MSHPQGFLEIGDRSRRLFQHAPARVAHWAEALLGFTADLFHGRVEGFQPCDTAFHNFEHTVDATVTVLDLLAAHREKPQFAPLQESDWLLCFASALFHDTGYLKRTGDFDGSGAKYGAIHVGRSCFVAWDFLPRFGFLADDLRQIQNAICATSVSGRTNQLTFRDRREWLIAAIVATGDMLGQVAAADYPERLPSLYLEFREASAFSRFRNSTGAYRNLLDLLRKTEQFVYRYVLPTLETEWGGVYRLLDDGAGRNVYLERMRLNIDRINTMARLLADGDSDAAAR